MNGIEYLVANVMRPWSIVIIFFIILVIYLVDWGSKKVDKLLQGDQEDE